MSSRSRAPVIVPGRGRLPNGHLFHSDLGIFDFQAEGVAEAWTRTNPDDDGGCLAVWDWGTGKSILSLVLGAYLFEDDLIDLVMIICEENKVREWPADLDRFTGLSAVRYHGAGRQQRLTKFTGKQGPPQVVVTTYETGRTELMTRVKRQGTRGKGTATDGPLVEALGLRDKRVLWIFDEPIKLRNRSSGIYQAYWYVLNQLRRGPHHQRVVGLTATSFETEISQAFNIARMMAPGTQPTIGQFEATYTHGRDPFDRYLYRHGAPEDYGRDHFQPIIMRKRKTDPDVIDQFPEMLEESEYIPLAKDQREFLTAVRTMLDPEDDEAEDPRSEEQIALDELRLYTLQRMTAGHPASHLHVDNELSRQIVEVVGADGLRAIGSAKTRRLIEMLQIIVKGQGAQVLIFERFTSVLVEVARELRAAGFTVGEFHGGLSGPTRERSKQAWKRGETEILFLSDAGARGMNLGEAQYVIEYSSATTYANRMQRGNRNNRIDVRRPSTTMITLVAEDTIEEAILGSMSKRNEAQDDLYGDQVGGRFVTAAARKQLLANYRARRGQQPTTEDEAA